MRNWAWPLACLLMLALPSAASAWGGAGHKVVCDIAWRELTGEAKKKIRTINRGDGYGTFAESCVWPDDIRSDAAISEPWNRQAGLAGSTDPSSGIGPS